MATSATTTGAKSFRMYLLTILFLFYASSGPKNKSVCYVVALLAAGIAGIVVAATGATVAAGGTFFAYSDLIDCAGYGSLRRELSLIETFLAMPAASLMDGDRDSIFY